MNKYQRDQFEIWFNNRVEEDHPNDLKTAWRNWWELKYRCEQADERLCTTYTHLKNNNPKEALNYVKDFFQ